MLTPMDSTAWRITTPERRLLLQVLLHGPITRATLSARLELSPATVARLARALVDAGILHECRPIIHGRARPQVPLDIDPSQYHVLGINLTARTATATLTDLRAASAWSDQTPLGTTSPDAVVDRVAELAAACRPRPAVIGVGLGGSSPDARTVDLAGYLDWHGVPLADLVERRTGIACVVSNDVEALAMAEGWFGAAAGHDNFNVVTIGTGIGFSAIRGGQLVRGRDGGRVLGGLPFTDPDAGIIRPGREFVTDPALVAEYRRLAAESGRDLPLPPSPDEIPVLARRGDPQAEQVVHTWARRAGIVISTGAAFTLPDLTLLMGERAHVADEHPDDLHRGLVCVRDATLPVPRVTVVPHDWYSWARGAAVLAIRGLLGLENSRNQVVQIDPLGAD